MTEEKAGKARRDPIEKASGNLEKALETISKRLLDQIKDGRNAEQGVGGIGEGDEAGGRDPAGAAGGTRRTGNGRPCGI